MSLLDAAPQLHVTRPQGKPTEPRCQLCAGTDLSPVLDLGQHPPSDGFLSEEQLQEQERVYPLRVLFCQPCRLAQLSEAVEPSLLFGARFIYRSGLNTPLKRHLQAIPAFLVAQGCLSEGELAVDIGSNDGTLLQGCRPYGVRVRGVDPSSIARLAIQEGIPTLQAFFNEATAATIRQLDGPAKVITATNVFAHVKDLQGVVNGVKSLLAERGVFLTESHYLLDMVEKLQYDEIYLEHLRYYSLESLCRLFDRFGMDVFHAQRVPTHGGSIRVLACQRGAYPIADSVHALRELEEKHRLHERETFEAFRRRVEDTRRQLKGLLGAIKAKGERVVGVGAPAKGNTLLNFCQIGPETVDYLVEKSDLKIGKYAPGSRIKIVEESRLFADQPEYALLLSWNIKEELIPLLRGRGYRGRFLVPNPVAVIE